MIVSAGKVRRKALRRVGFTRSYNSAVSSDLSFALIKLKNSTSLATSCFSRCPGVREIVSLNLKTR